MTAMKTQMNKERADLTALAASLEERRKGLDEMDRHLQAFGEDCEAQREANEAQARILAKDRQNFDDECQMQMEKIAKESMRLTMQGTRLEQEQARVDSERRGVAHNIAAAAGLIKSSTSMSTSSNEPTTNQNAKKKKGASNAPKDLKKQQLRSKGAAGSGTAAVRSRSSRSKKKR